MAISAGTKVGQYEVQDFIGQGAMGMVYRAYHAQLQRTGAMKVIQAVSPDADTVARFRHEAQAIARMRHPNIVDVYDFGEFEGTPYMIVEYVPGGSLAARLAERRLNRAEALRYLRGIAAGLDYAHEHGVVHRDVKPANVLLTSDDTPVLADFGLAKLLQGSSVRSMTGVTTGTPAYMAPEQVTGSKVGPAADRYSLATIAYEMLTGVIPFDGQALMELLYSQVHSEPPAPSARNSSLGPQVDAVILRGLAKDPAARWESCTEFVDALAAALFAPPPAAVARTVVMAPPRVAAPAAVAASAPPVATPLAPPVTPAPARATPPRRRGHLWRNIAIGAAAVFVLVLALGVCLSLVAPTITVVPSTVSLGQYVHVTASHVPAHQAGSIQLHSAVKVFPFVADGNGGVSVYITVPRDIALGDHTVEICWNASCHASTTLHVIESTGAVVSPTPAPTATPTSTASATAHPTSTPIATAKPTPSPPVISVTSFEVKRGGSETVGGLRFAPGSTVTVTFKQGSGSGRVMGSAVVSSSGYWTLAFLIPPDAAVGYALLTACDSANGCYDATIRVIS